MRCAGLLLLVLAAGCARPIAPQVPDTPEARACRVEARDPPERRALMERRFTDNARQVDEALQAAEMRAFRACMRRRGVIGSDGVEPVRR